MILLAKEITGASTNFSQKTLGALDMDVARNAYGAQIESFEAVVEITGVAGAVRATFIPAPPITRVGPAVEVLARWRGQPVLVRQKRLMACAFHPEIAGEQRLHQLWLDTLRDASKPHEES
jgi:5'-phosphate synthase pdxT subunit